MSRNDRARAISGALKTSTVGALSPPAQAAAVIAPGRAEGQQSPQVGAHPGGGILAAMWAEPARIDACTGPRPAVIHDLEQVLKAVLMRAFSPCEAALRQTLARPLPQIRRRPRSIGRGQPTIPHGPARAGGLTLVPPAPGFAAWPTPPRHSGAIIGLCRVESRRRPLLPQQGVITPNLLPRAIPVRPRRHALTLPPHRRLSGLAPPRAAAAGLSARARPHPPAPPTATAGPRLLPRTGAQHEAR